MRKMLGFTYADVLVKNEIRLLEVLPGNWIDVLTGRLYKSDTSQRYTALSYCWGCLETVRKMEIDGQFVSISSNLERALRTIRLQTQPIILLVDAICINQENHNERKSNRLQVRDLLRMQTVFTLILATPSTWIPVTRYITKALTT
jgi:Heterokaryon incompatibility protein (HET)